MLNRDSELASPEKIISDNLTHKPSVGQSAWNNYSLGQATAPHAIASFNEQYNTSPTGKAMQINFENLRRGNENQEVGWGQWGVNEVSNMLGQTLSPFTWMFGEVGLLATKPFTAAASAIIPASSLLRQPISKLMNESAAKYIPELAGKGEQAQTLSMALLGKSYTEAFGVGAGVTLPQATIDNFNAETGKHDFLGIAKEIGAGGVLGMGLSTIPFAWGILKHNIFRRTGIDVGNVPPGGGGEGGTEEPFPSELALRQAVKDGKLSQDSFDFWLEMQNIDKENAAARATKFVAEQGHTVDHATDTAQFEILNRDQINNLQSATLDQLVSDHIPENQRSALTDFTVQAGIDDMRNNPGLLDGVRGYVDYADERLAKKDEVLANADALVDQHLNMPHVESDFPLTQAHLLEGVKKSKELPVTIPDNVAERAKQEARIAELEKRNEKLFANYEKTGESHFTDKMKANNEEIEKLKSELLPLESPVEELRKIRSKISPLAEDDIVFEEPTKKGGDYNVLTKEIYQDGYSTGKGHITMGLSDDGKSFEVISTGLPLQMKGKGVGKMLYKRAIQEAVKRGLGFQSDAVVSKEAMRVYKSLEKEGYRFKYDETIETVRRAGSEQFETKNGRDPVVKLEYAPQYISTKKGLPKNLRNTKAFHRLQDLAEIWQPAKTLLDRIKLEEDIQKQEAYRDLAKQMLDIADNNIGKQAKVDSVRDYLEARTKQRIDEPTAESMAEVTEANKVPTDHDIIIAETDRAMDELTHEKAKEEYTLAKEKFEEFKKSENIFKSMINCILGAKG